MERLRKEPKGDTGLFKRDYEFIKGALYAGYGINLRNPRNGKEFRIVDIYKSPEMRSTHLIVLGRTRWGKTRLIERLEVDDIESGFSIFHLDPKQDYSNLEAVIDAVLRTERYDDFIPFMPMYEEVSVKINTISELLPDTISEVLIAMSPKKVKDEFFKELTGEIGKAVSTSMYLQGHSEVRIIDIFRHTTIDEIERLYQYVLDESERPEGYVKIGSEIVPKAKLINDALLSLNKLRKKEKGFWSKVNSTAELVLGRLSTGKIGSSFGRAKGNPLRDRMLSGKPFIFYALLGSMALGADPSGRIARMLNAMHEKVYGEVYKRFSVLEPPVSEYWDEGSVVIYDKAFEKINKIGGIGGYVHIFTQSFADFSINAGAEETKVFFDNADFLLMSVIDQETAEYFSRSAGEVYKTKPMWTKDEGIVGVPEKVRLIPSDLFMRMPKGAFHAFIEGSWYRGYSPMLKDRRRIIIEPLPYDESRLLKHFAEKYNLSPTEASQIIKQQDVARDYDWIMKEGLADVWIDLKEFPYYKNYVANYKDDTEELLNVIKTEESAPEEVELTQEQITKLKISASETVGQNLKKVFVRDGRLFVHFYTYKAVFEREPEYTTKIKDGGHDYVYAVVKIKNDEDLKDFSEM